MGKLGFGGFNPTDQRNPSSSFGLVRLYSLLSILVLTLVLIGILEYANRNLPQSSGTHYNPAAQLGTFPKRQLLAPSSATTSTSSTPALINLNGAPVPVTSDNSSVPADPTSSSATTPVGSYNTLTANVTSDSTSPTSGTEIFVPATVVSTILPTACSASSTSIGCTCPFNSDITDCVCTPDQSATSCACTFGHRNCSTTANGVGCRAYQDCVCPPDSCSVCHCPVNQGSSRSAPCSCPVDPYQAGCSCYWREASPFVPSESNCTMIRECFCGLSVVSSQCSAPTTVSAPNGISVSIISISFSPTPSANLTANSTSLILSPTTVNSTTIATVPINSTTPPYPTFNSSVTPAVSSPDPSLLPGVPFVSLSTNGSTAIPVTLIPSVTPNSSAIPIVSSRPIRQSSITDNSTSLSIAYTPPPVTASPSPPVSSSVSTSQSQGVLVGVVQVSIPPSPTTIPNTPSSPPAITLFSPTIASSSTTAQSQPAQPPQISVPILSISIGPNAQGVPVTAISTVGTQLVSSPTPTGAVPILSLSISTNSQNQPVTSPVTIGFILGSVPPAATPVVSLSTGINVQNQQPTTSPVTVGFIPAQPQVTPPITAGSNIPPELLGPIGDPTAPPPILLFSTGVNSQGQPTTSPVIITPPASPNVPTGIVFFVSSSLSTGTSGSSQYVPVTFIQVQINPSLPVITASSQQYSVPTSFFVPDASSSTITSASSPSQSSSGGGGGGGGGGSGGDGKSSGSSSGNSGVQVALFLWPTSKTFLGGYLPIFLAKIYQMIWSVVHNHATDNLPFNQLASPNGAPITALFSPTSWITMVPFIASWFLVPFASETIFFDTNYGCSNPDTSNPSNPCWPPIMTINPWVSRLIQGILSFLALTTVVMIALWFKKPNDVTNEPTSIAAVTAIAGNPQVTKDFTCHPEATTKDLKKSLEDKRYKLDYFEVADGRRRYGLIPADSSDGESSDSPADPPSLSSRFTFGRGWKDISTYIDAIFLGYLSVLLSLTAVYLRDVNKSSLARLFNGSTFGRRLFFTVLGSVACMNIGRIERETQTVAPYMRLHEMNATPTPTILLRKHSLPLTSFLPMIRNGHFVAAIVAFAALLSEFLVVVFSGLPYRPGQLRSEFMFCGIASLTVISIMLLTIVMINVWRRRLPQLPRKPDNVAAVLTYVCQSNMVEDFEGVEALSVRERDRRIRNLKKRYGYRVRKGEDGLGRWTVDEIPGTGSNSEAHLGYNQA